MSDWLNGSFDSSGRIYFNKKIRTLAGVGGGKVRYKIDTAKNMIIITKANREEF